MYIFYGHMVYEYSFLIDLYILSLLVHSVFSVRHLHWIYGLVYHFWPEQLSLTKLATGLGMSFGLWLWMMIICGLSMSVRHIHASDDGLSWWLVLLLWLSTFTGFIIIIILPWMEPLMYIFYGHMVYKYSFLVVFKILSPLMHSIFSFGHLYWIHGSIYQFVAVWPQ